MQQPYGLCAVALIAMELTACGKTHVSGVYTASTETKAALLQLVENDEGDISGRVEVVQLKPDGSIADLNAAVTGVADGKTITLSLKPTWSAAAGNAEATAVVEGDNLSLAIAGVPASGHYYHKSDLSDFEKHASALRARSAKLLAQQAVAADSERQRETDSELAARQSQAIAAQAANQKAAWVNVASASSTLGIRLDAFNARFDRVMARVPIVEQQFRRLSVAPDGRDKSIELNNWVEQGLRSFDQDKAAFDLDITAVEAECAGLSSNNPDSSAAVQTCAAIRPKVALYRRKSLETSAAISKLEAVYRSASDE